MEIFIFYLFLVLKREKCKIVISIKIFLYVYLWLSITSLKCVALMYIPINKFQFLSYIHYMKPQLSGNLLSLVIDKYILGTGDFWIAIKSNLV